MGTITLGGHIRIGQLVFVIGALLLAISAFAETLEEAWKIAIASDQRLQAIRKLTESARETLSAAKATHFPTLALNSGYTVLDNQPTVKIDLPPIIPLPLKELPFADDRFWTYSATISIPVFASGRISRGIDAARAGHDAALADEVGATLDLKMAVAEAYVGVLRTKHALRVAKRQVESLSAHAGDVANFFQQGIVARNDLLAAQVSLAIARQKVIQTTNAMDVGRAVYNRLLGRSLDARVDVAELSAAPIEPDLEAISKEAIDRRPELQRLAHEEQSLYQQASSIRASSLPQIALKGGYSYLQNTYLVHESLWFAMAAFQWNIFDSGLIRHQANAVQQKAESVSRLKADFTSVVAFQVRQAWLDVQETRKRLVVATEAVEQAEENLKVTKDRYRNGVGTNTEVLDAETLRTRSYTNKNNAIYDAVLADLRLRRAAGEL